MHRFRSSSAPFQLWLGSLALIGCILGSVAALGLFIWTLVEMNGLLLRITGGVIGFTILSGFVHLLMAFRVRCPLCHGKPLTSLKCVRHRNARTSLGSIRLGVAKDVLQRGQYRCPYCGEPVEVAHRER